MAAGGPSSVALLAEACPEIGMENVAAAGLGTESA